MAWWELWKPLTGLFNAIWAWLDKYSVIIFYTLGIPSFVLSYILGIMFILGIDIKLKPRPMLVKRKFKWDSRAIAVMGLSAALMVVFFWGHAIPVIPGVMGVDIFLWIMYFAPPVVFGVPGIWGLIPGNIIGDLLVGWFGWGVLGYIANLSCGWVFWRTYGQDTSLRTKKSWANFLFAFFVAYVFWNNLHWCTTAVLAGAIPLQTFYALRLTFNLFWMIPWIWLYPLITWALEGLARKYGLHWTDFEYEWIPLWPKPKEGTASST